MKQPLSSGKVPRGSLSSKTSSCAFLSQVFVCDSLASPSAQLSGFASVPALALPSPAVSLSLSLFSSVSFVSVYLWVFPGFFPASLPSSSFKHPEPPSVYDWLICKPLTQKLGH